MLGLSATSGFCLYITPGAPIDEDEGIRLPVGNASLACKDLDGLIGDGLSTGVSWPGEVSLLLRRVAAGGLNSRDARFATDDKVGAVRREVVVAAGTAFSRSIGIFLLEGGMTCPE